MSGQIYGRVEFKRTEKWNYTKTQTKLAFHVNLKILIGEILVCAQCPSCPLPFCPSGMPFHLDDISFNALHQNALLEMPFWNCPFLKMPFSICPFLLTPFIKMPFWKCPFLKMPFRKCPFKNALYHYVIFQIVLCNALSQFSLYQIAINQERNFFFIQVISDCEISNA